MIRKKDLSSSPARCARRTATQSGGLVWLSDLDVWSFLARKARSVSLAALARRAVAVWMYGLYISKLLSVCAAGLLRSTIKGKKIDSLRHFSSAPIFFYFSALAIPRTKIPRTRTQKKKTAPKINVRSTIKGQGSLLVRK